MESQTNAILTGMAVSDLLVIATYIPYVIHNFFRTEVAPEEMYTYGWAVFTLFYAHNTVLFHTISIWLTVLLAVWRYITVRYLENFTLFSVIINSIKLNRRKSKIDSFLKYFFR